MPVLTLCPFLPAISVRSSSALPSLLLVFCALPGLRIKLSPVPLLGLVFSSSGSSATQRILLGRISARFCRNFHSLSTMKILPKASSKRRTWPILCCLPCSACSSHCARQNVPVDEDKRMQHPPEHIPPAAPRRTLRQAFNWRTLKYGSHASLFTVIVLAVVCLLYSLAVQHNRRFDITQAKRFTLAEQSVKLLQGLQYPIKVIGFYSLAERDRETFTDLVKQYAQHTDKLSYDVVDPDRQPALAKQYDITAYNTVVVEGNGKKEKISRVEEAALTNAILKVTRNTKKVVYFVTGHGEPSLTDSDRMGYSVAKQALEEQNYTVQELVLARQPQVPDDAAVVIEAGPRRDLLESETEALSTYLGRGGHLLVMLDPETVPDLVAFVKRYGIEVGNDVVIETNPLGRLIGGDYLMPVVMTYEPHAITKELGNVMTMFPVVRSVQVAKELPPGITAQELAMTSTES